VENEMDEEFMEDLLTSLLECGSGDLERLNNVLRIAKKFGITIDDVLNDAEGISEKSVKFNDIMYAAMRLTLDEIADRAEEQGEQEIADELRDQEIYVNYIDSWFNIEALDGDVDEIEKLTPTQIVERVIKELKENEQ
jgi:monoamine oxidase